ncbi:hypothetical protein HME9302_00949 [Alteripontixanthobacter maritimus]|uniref:Uncharacterized protein n=1 Tax=Alteripontixanthobacter maritimus TaxID=2161824 RepID=A0A369Q4V0_9SPHN|nr:hypothetical protein [Alteripontixanthobacter maritimus]RDC59754.1 hypothetical protein HME9302_00949 [Alteripontixanthobacter maritimus]
MTDRIEPGTPLPWEYEDNYFYGSVTADTECGNGWIICDMSVRTDLVCNAHEDLAEKHKEAITANAAYIVHTANTHPLLVEALGDVFETLIYIFECSDCAASSKSAKEAADKIETTLSAARGEQVT